MKAGRPAQILLTVWAVAVASAAVAVQPDEVLPDRGLEARARTISAEMRCVVCQNQSIDDSEAPLARDLRLLVRERLKAGDTDQAVLDFISARYGAFVLLKPPFAWSTIILWGGPAALVIAACVALLAGRRHGPPRSPPPLTPHEQERLRGLVDPTQG